MRTVTLKLMTQAAPVELQVDDSVQTWGELKNAIQPDYNLSGMKVIERNSKVSFELDDAELPEGDLFLFVVPTKVKAGLTPRILVENAKEEINEILDDLMDDLEGDVTDFGSILTKKEDLNKEMDDIIGQL